MHRETKPEPDIPSGGGNSEDKTKPELTQKEPGQMTVQQAVDQAKKADTHAQLANEKSSSNGSTDSNEDFGGKCDGGCCIDVTVQYRMIEYVQKNGVNGGLKKGTGRPSVSSLGKKETYTFNSYELARQFADNMKQIAQDKFDSWGYSTGSEDYLSNDVVIGAPDLGIDPTTGLVCTEPPAEEREMTGKTTEPAPEA